MAPPDFSNGSTGKSQVLDWSQRSPEAARTNTPTTQPSLKSKFSSSSARPRQDGPCPPPRLLSHAHPPLPQLHPSLSDTGPRGPHPATAVTPSPPLPRRRQTKGGRRRGAAGATPAAGSRCGGALPAASVLRVPGLRLRTDRPRDNGPRPQLGLAGPGLSGTGPRLAEGGCRPGWRRGGEGRRGGRTKPTADRRTEGGKDGDASRGSAPFALSQRVGRVPEPHLSPPAAAAPTPPGSRGARLALWAGPQGKGPGRRDLGSIQSLAFQRGPALVLVLETLG